MSLSRTFSPVLHFEDGNGHPLAGGYLCTYIAGTNTPVATFRDGNGTLNPTQIQLDSRGECEVWLDSALEYKFTLYDSTKTTPIWTKDHITTNMLLAENPLFIDPHTRMISILPKGICRKYLKNWHNLVPDARFLQFKDFNGNVVITLCDKLQEWLEMEGYTP